MVVFLILHLCRSISSSCNRWNDLLSKEIKSICRCVTELIMWRTESGPWPSRWFRWRASFGFLSKLIFDEDVLCHWMIWKAECASGKGILMSRWKWWSAPLGSGSVSCLPEVRCGWAWGWWWVWDDVRVKAWRCAEQIHMSVSSGSRSNSSSFAVTGEKLIQEQLKGLVEGHAVIFAQVVTAGRAGEHLGSKRPLQTGLESDTRQQTDGCYWLIWGQLLKTTLSTKTTPSLTW